MNTYKLFFDTDCDITPEIAKKYDAGLISMPYAVEGEEIYPYVTWQTFDVKGFQNMLRKGTIPTTSAITVEEYKRYFEPFLKEGKDILYIHFSRAMTVTFTNCDQAIKELKEKYPDRRIELIDTKAITLGSFYLCLEMAELYASGKSIDEMLKWAETEIDHAAFYFFADNLKFFARSGRVSGFSAFMGGMIGIKPIIYINNEGKMVSIDKAIGRKKALDKIMDYMDKVGDDVANHKIIIAHADSMNLVEELIALCKAKYGDNLDILVEDINPTAGSHCGPDCAGIAFHAKHR